jgi:hypothetical protein
MPKKNDGEKPIIKALISSIDLGQGKKKINEK